MLSFFPDGWTIDGTGTKANEVLSKLDKGFVAGAKMYPKPAPAGSEPVELEIGGDRRDAVIGQRGEEDVFCSARSRLRRSGNTRWV